MSNLDGNVKDIYSMDNPDVEAAWKAVRYEHVTAITAEEARRLPGHRQTAELYGPQEGYAVLLEVFHQVHCLVSFGNVRSCTVLILDTGRYPESVLRESNTV